MPICKKCNKSFPTQIVVNKKKTYLHHRSYCLECAPIKSKKGYEIRRSRTNHKGQKKTCPLCKQIFPWTTNNVCSGCRTGIRRFINREKAIKLLGGKCQCGIDDPDVLTFHHIDPSKKEFGLCCSWHLAWADIEKELAKCQLLCYNCHMKVHCQERKKYLKYAPVVKSANTQDYRPDRQVKSCAH